MEHVQIVIVFCWGIATSIFGGFIILLWIYWVCPPSIFWRFHQFLEMPFHTLASVFGSVEMSAYFTLFFWVIHLEPCPWCPCNALTSLIPLAPKSNHCPSLAIEFGTTLLLSTSGLHKFWVVRRFGKISVSWDHPIYIYRLGNNTQII